MSDVFPGPGWWLASDGKWYDPSTHPDASYREAFGATPATPEAEVVESTETEAASENASDFPSVEIVPPEDSAQAQNERIAKLGAVIRTASKLRRNDDPVEHNGHEVGAIAETNTVEATVASAGLADQTAANMNDQVDVAPIEDRIPPRDVPMEHVSEEDSEPFEQRDDQLSSDDTESVLESAEVASDTEQFEVPLVTPVEPSTAGWARIEPDAAETELPTETELPAEPNARPEEVGLIVDEPLSADSQSVPMAPPGGAPAPDISPPPPEAAPTPIVEPLTDDAASPPLEPPPIPEVAAPMAPEPALDDTTVVPEVTLERDAESTGQPPGIGYFTGSPSPETENEAAERTSGRSQRTQAEAFEETRKARLAEAQRSAEAMRDNARQDRDGDLRFVDEFESSDDQASEAPPLRMRVPGAPAVDDGLTPPKVPKVAGRSQLEIGSQPSETSSTPRFGMVSAEAADEATTALIHVETERVSKVAPIDRILALILFLSGVGMIVGTFLAWTTGPADEIGWQRADGIVVVVAGVLATATAGPAYVGFRSVLGRAVAIISGVVALAVVGVVAVNTLTEADQTGLSLGAGLYVVIGSALAAVAAGAAIGKNTYLY